MSSPSQTNPGNGRVDHREQLFNGRESGPVHQVALPTENITSLFGIAFDLDRDHFKAEGPFGIALEDVESFAAQVIQPMLDRHPALRDAEIRDTGRNIHVIVQFDEPVVFVTDSDRERWKAIVEIVQAALPIDPDMPGLTTLTRAVGSINGKTDRPVRILKAGQPVLVAEVLKLQEQLLQEPFKTVAGIFFGSDRISPCPSCGVAGTTLKALRHDGRCYGSCGKVPLERLYDAFLAPRVLPGKEVKNARS